ncbi:M23 family metallopeptidase [Paramicrobacterium agarici]|nr:M23 family metallopeptidase [Microbacterium agarici]
MSTPVDLSYPFAGRWLVRNSPANRIPSHGTRLFATAYAIDFVPVTEVGRTAPITLGSFVKPEPAERFPGFGRPILAPVHGVIVATHDGELDHHAHRGLPSIRYALTQQRRAGAGWAALAGNHVLIEGRDAVLALCHLRQDSIMVRLGQEVQVGDELGSCGNSGNSTEPHVHVQALDNRDVDRAQALPITFNGSLPANGDVVHAQTRAAE